MREFIHSLKIQTRVLHALMMREIITRYGRENIGFLWLFFEPAIFTIAVTIIWSLIRTNYHDFPITALALTGYTASLAWRYGAGRTLATVQANMGLLYHPLVSIFDLLVSRLILEVLGATGSFIFLAFFFASLGLIEPPVDYWFVVIGWTLQIWFSVGLSLIIGSLGSIYDVVERTWHVISYILFILSGAFFLVEWLPPQVREYVLLVPTVSNIEILRYGFVGDKMIPHYNINYSILFNLFMTFFAFLSYKWIEGKIELE